MGDRVHVGEGDLPIDGYAHHCPSERPFRVRHQWRRPVKQPSDLGDRDRARCLKVARQDVRSRLRTCDPRRGANTLGKPTVKGIPDKAVSPPFAFGHFANEKVVLEVEDGNQKGISFYSKYGFTYEGRTVVKIGGEEIPCLLGELHL